MIPAKCDKDKTKQNKKSLVKFLNLANHRKKSLIEGRSRGGGQEWFFTTVL